MLKLLFLLACIGFMANADTETDIDIHTYSNFLSFDPIKIDLDLQIKFDTKYIYGYVRHHLKALKNDVKDIYLDIGQYLTITQIFVEKNGDKQEIDTKNYQLNSMPLSYQLQIKVGSIWSEIKLGDYFYVDIYYYTQIGLSQYMIYYREATDEGINSYFYVTCKPFCRELLPLMDSLALKTPVNIEIDHAQEWDFYASGTLVSTKPSNISGYEIEEFDEGKQIPPYSITIFGSTNAVRIHDLDQVYFVSTPELGEDIVLEFQKTIQYLIDSIEVYLDENLPFDNIQLIFPPKNFPYFDLEAGYSSYISETILTGDGNETYNVARTIARQYFGSCITPQNWSNIWITEGLVAFMERKMIEQTRGKIFADTDAMLGNHTLYTEMLELGMKNTFTSLLPTFSSGENPSDYMTEVPREKGFQLFKTIEQVMSTSKLKNPRSNDITPMQQFLRDFVNKFLFTVDTNLLDYDSFRDFWWDWVTDAMQDPAEIISKVNFNVWVKQPGMPVTTLDFGNALQQELRNLGEVYLQLGGVAKPSNWHLLAEQEVEYYITFLDYLVDNYKRMTTKIYQQLDRYYNISQEQDLQLTSIWFSLAIVSKQSKDKQVLAKIQNYLSSVGRLELVAPIYEAFNITSQRETGCELLRQNSYWMHPLAVEYFTPLKCLVTGQTK